MPRIRSVHPSLFTDEAWVSCSPLARLLYIGLWTDADDQGVFEWKPLQLKMRLLPGDMADALPLLVELVGVGLIGQYDMAGKRYGAIKQFRKYQRPKKPNAIHPLPPEWRDFVYLSDVSSEVSDLEGDEVPPQFPTEGEKSPQMEDGGGRREEISEAIASSVADGVCERDFEALWKAYPHVKGRSSRPRAIAAWLVLTSAERAALPVAAERYAKEGQRPQNGPCALERWLLEGRYHDWFEAPDTPSTWRGPEDVRETFVAQLGDEWCRAYLDPCAWQDVPERALIPHTSYAGRKLVREGRAILAKLGLVVLERAA